MIQPTLICLTPVKNESWILDRFLQCASTWADHIIIADQCSDDGTREIARCYPKVTLIENPSPTYDEGGRQRLLLEAARRLVPGPRLLIALDADEMLTANFRTSSEWQQVLSAQPGTVIRFRWANVWPNFQQAWVTPTLLPLGFMDDGREHHGEAIHSARIPIRPDSPELVLEEIKVLHYQYTDWERMKSKQRWYQCWERINNPSKRPVQIYRQYHHMDAVPAREMQVLQNDWLAGYEAQNIEMRSICRQAPYPWDAQVLEWLDKYGERPFRRLAIWDVNWEERAHQFGLEIPSESVRDLRNPVEKQVHRWLSRTQSSYMQSYTRFLQRLLILFGW